MVFLSKNMASREVHKIEISYRTVVFTVLFLIFLAFLYYIRDEIMQVFIALLIMVILNPTVTKLQKLKVPRAVSVTIVYLLVLVFLSISIAIIAPPLITQSTNFASSLPKILSDLKIPGFLVDQLIKEFTAQIGSLPSYVIRASISVFSNILAVISVLFFALYLLLARDKLEEQLGTFFTKKQADTIERIITELEKSLGGWARGELILMFMVGLATYIGLVLIGIPFALPLALLAGILEIIPNFGPIISAFPSIIVGFGISPITGLAAAALGVLVQQLENYLLVPKVMQSSAGVSPLITLLALVIGFKLAGISGAILSVPVVITLKVIFKEFPLYPNNKQ